MNNFYRILFLCMILPISAASPYRIEERPTKISNYKNPKDIGLVDFFKLGNQWARATAGVLEGMRMLDVVEKPLVTFFGGHAVDKKSPYYAMASSLALKLATEGIGIMTGGGAGIMEAANCAAASVRGKGFTSIAIGIQGLDTNRCAQKRIELDYFFPRKWLLMEYSSAFIIFPGGMGTMDELSQLVTLMSKKQMTRVPIYVIGQNYWRNFKKWLLEDAVGAKLIDKSTVGLITFTDDIDRIVREILEWVVQHQPKSTDAAITQNLTATEIMGI